MPEVALSISVSRAPPGGPSGRCPAADEPSLAQRREIHARPSCGWPHWRLLEVLAQQFQRNDEGDVERDGDAIDLKRLEGFGLGLPRAVRQLGHANGHALEVFLTIFMYCPKSGDSTWAQGLRQRDKKRSSCQRVMPRLCAACTWLRGTCWMPARISSPT